MRNAIILSLILLFFGGGLAGDLKGWQAVRANITNSGDLYEIQQWELDVWSYDSNLIIGLNDIMVNSSHVDMLMDMNIDFEVLVPDVEAMLEEGAKGYVNESSADWFASYHTYAEFNTFLNNISSTYPTLVKQTTIGQSINGLAINALIITGTASGTKKRVVFSGLQHAREWVSAATVAYIINQLVTGYSTDPVLKGILDQLTFYIVPIVNPDGYTYTWASASNRLWRKNRRANSGGSYGVDLNRNWDDHWGGEGSSGTPTSDTYRGTAPFSEPESKALSAFILNNGPFSGYIDFHAYSQLVLRPYGWTRTLPPDAPIQKQVGDQMSQAIYNVNKVSYTSEPANQLYITSGSSDDWAYGKGVKLSYTIELRDTGRYGFQLPPDQIIPTGQENWAAVKYFANFIISSS